MIVSIVQANNYQSFCSCLKEEIEKCREREREKRAAGENSVELKGKSNKGRLPS